MTMSTLDIEIIIAILDSIRKLRMARYKSVRIPCYINLSGANHKHIDDIMEMVDDSRITLSFSDGEIRVNFSGMTSNFLLDID